MSDSVKALKARLYEVEHVLAVRSERVAVRRPGFLAARAPLDAYEREVRPLSDGGEILRAAASLRHVLLCEQAYFLSPTTRGSLAR